MAGPVAGYLLLFQTSASVRTSYSILVEVIIKSFYYHGKKSEATACTG
jgi:hypothetical protein